MYNTYFLLISAALSLIILYDLFSSLRNSKKNKEVRFVVRNITNAANYISCVLVVFAMAFGVYVYLLSKDKEMLYIAYWMLLLLVQSVTYMSKTGGIYEDGIWFSGRFYGWDLVKAYYCDKNTGRIGLAVTKKFFGSSYKGKLRVQSKKNDVEGINRLLSDKVNNTQVVG